MSMPAMKTEATAVALPATPAPVVTMTPKRAPRAEKYIKMARETAARVVPPLIVIALLMLFWELVCRRAGSTLPPPSRVFKDTKELIFDPFFDRGDRRHRARHAGRSVGLGNARARSAIPGAAHHPAAGVAAAVARGVPRR